MSPSDPRAWVVHKFGGSSVADAACFERVASILESQPRERLAVVLSACKGVTDALLDLVKQAERQSADWEANLAAIRARHAQIAASLLPAAVANTYLSEFDLDCAVLGSVLKTTQVMRTADLTIRDKVSGYGEIWSTLLFALYLQQRGQRRGIQWLD